MINQIVVRKNNVTYSVAIHRDDRTSYHDICTYEEVGELIAGNCRKTTFVNCESDFIIPKK